MTLSTRSTITLTLAELALYQQGHWDAYNIELSATELADQYNLQGPVVVLDPAHRVLFGLTPPRRERRRL
jgi:hypothetical protein